MPKTTNEKLKGIMIGTGRRKTATARIFLKEEKGEFIVNGINIDDYFTVKTQQGKWVKPFHLLGVSHPKSKYSATIKVEGSGKAAQIDAIVHGLSRALAYDNIENAKILRRQGLLTRDSRMVERKKPYLHKARKAPQYSKR